MTNSCILPSDTAVVFFIILYPTPHLQLQCIYTHSAQPAHLSFGGGRMQHFTKNVKMFSFYFFNQYCTLSLQPISVNYVLHIRTNLVNCILHIVQINLNRCLVVPFLLSGHEKNNERDVPSTSRVSDNNGFTSE